MNSRFFRGHLYVFAFLVPFLVTQSGRAQNQQAPPAGQKIFFTGHSFHVFVPAILSDLVQKAGIKGHQQLGLSSIGGSRVIQHWKLAEDSDKFKAKETLKGGKADVLTISPIHLPDEGIENFAKLALENNPNIRIMVQEFWLPFDMYDTTFKLRPKTVDHNAITIDELKKLHAPYFQGMDAHVRELNQKLSKDKAALFVVPVGQAVLALRAKIVAGEAPGLKEQNDLFTDAIGHAKAPLAALAAYCHYATIYRTSPVGLPMPAVLEKGKEGGYAPELNRLLQELAWEAVTGHPLSGVSVQKK